MQITHPFHPLRGREFPLLDERRNRHGDRVWFQADDGVLRTVPRAWTDQPPMIVPIPMLEHAPLGPPPGLRQLETWISGDKITGVQDLQTLVSTLLAIGIGKVVGRVIAHRWRWITPPVEA